MLTRSTIKAVFFLGLVIILTGCGLPRPAAPTPFNDLVATQVAVLLTASPAATVNEPNVVTATIAPETQAATATATPLPPTSAPSVTPTATETPPPTPTAVEGDPRQTLGDPTFQDTKFKEDVNWGSAWKDEFTQGEFSNNEMVLTSVGVDGWTLTWPIVTDFYIEMTATTGDCSGMDRYGLIVRVPKSFDRGYLYGFTCDGKYSLRIWDPAKKQYTYLINWTHSDEIMAGSNKTNRIGLMARGEKFTLYANGVEIDSATDSRFDKGQFGPYIGHANTEDFTIYIKEIAYWDLS
jgi:hypothetical protein